jgi:hypothetical protein
MFGFSFSAEADPSRAILFSEAIAPASGTAASIHLFYSVAQAKELLTQLQTVINQAQGGNPDDV